MKLNINIPTELVQSKLNIKKIAYTISSLIVCIGIIIISNKLELERIVYAMCASIGYIGAIVSLIQCFNIKYIIYKPTGSLLINKDYEFSSDKLETITTLIQEKDFSQLEKNMNSKTPNGYGMKIHLAYSLDKEFAAYQIYKYVPYQYETYSEVEYIK